MVALDLFLFEALALKDLPGIIEAKTDKTLKANIPGYMLLFYYIILFLLFSIIMQMFTKIYV